MDGFGFAEDADAAFSVLFLNLNASLDVLFADVKPPVLGVPFPDDFDADLRAIFDEDFTPLPLLDFGTFTFP